MGANSDIGVDFVTLIPNRVSSSTKNRILAYCVSGALIAGILSLLLESPYWLISSVFFVIAILIPTVSIMWKISCLADSQIQKFLNDRGL